MAELRYVGYARAKEIMERKVKYLGEEKTLEVLAALGWFGDNVEYDPIGNVRIEGLTPIKIIAFAAALAAYAKQVREEDTGWATTAVTQL